MDEAKPSEGKPAAAYIGSTVPPCLAELPVRIGTVINALSSIGDITRDLDRFGESFRAAFDGIKIQFDALRSFNQELSKKITALSKGLPQLPELEERIGQSILILAKHGWFISLFETPMETIAKAGRLLIEARHEAANELLCENFRNECDVIAENLMAAFPDRSSILAKAFTAHKEQNFELSIPVLLAQADGIGKEIFGVSVYSRRGKYVSVIEKKLAADPAEGLADRYRNLVITLLPINEQTDRLEKYHNP